MGAHPWFYFVPFENEIQQALERLKLREFHAGRYNPVIPFPTFPVDETQRPGTDHVSIEHAIKQSKESGTRSILDMKLISTKPDYFVVSPLDPNVLEDLYDTPEPTRTMIEEDMDFFENIERGHGIYIIIYKDDKPDEILFAGYSFD